MIGKMNPPADPANPPRPVTLATAFLGNMSDTVVNRFADHAWCAAPARPIRHTVTQMLSTLVTKKIGSTHSAKMNIETLRARVTVQPSFARYPGTQPPKIESTVMIP